jgi:hypothetical protein
VFMLTCGKVRDKKRGIYIQYIKVHRIMLRKCGVVPLSIVLCNPCLNLRPLNFS